MARTKKPADAYTAYRVAAATNTADTASAATGATGAASGMGLAEAITGDYPRHANGTADAGPGGVGKTLLASSAATAAAEAEEVGAGNGGEEQRGRSGEATRSGKKGKGRAGGQRKRKREKVTREQVQPSWHRACSFVPGHPSVTLHNEMLDLCDLVLPTHEEKLELSQALTYLRRVVADTFGNQAKVHVFGSQLTGLALPGSDVDTVVTGVPDDSIDRLGRAMKSLKNRGQLRSAIVVKSAKVPIMKLVHAATGVQLDVSFNQMSGLESSKAAKDMMRQMKPVRPLVMVLKVYMRQLKLNETYRGGIGSFLLQLMVMAVVQKIGRDSKSQGCEPPEDLGFLLQEFFDFYGNQLDYGTTGITLEGDGGFYNKREVGRFDERRPYLLSVQNPFHPLVDTASNSYKIEDCKAAFMSTSMSLKAAIHFGGGGGAATESLLRYCIHPQEVQGRLLPPPTFCSKNFNEAAGGLDIDEWSTRKIIEEKAQKLMERYGAEQKTCFE